MQAWHGTAVRASHCWVQAHATVEFPEESGSLLGLKFLQDGV